jgi:hypothetical protein
MLELTERHSRNPDFGRLNSCPHKITKYIKEYDYDIQRNEGRTECPENSERTGIFNTFLATRLECGRLPSVAGRTYFG